MSYNASVYTRQGKDKKVEDFQPKETFETLLKTKAFQSGGDGGNRTRVRKT